MPKLRGKFLRLFALLALIAGLLGPSAPAFAAAAPAAPSPSAHAAIDCGDRHEPAPSKHSGGSIQCCIAAVCAMTLALPASPSGIVLPFPAAAPRYDLRARLQPPGIAPQPIPHPPKTAA